MVDASHANSGKSEVRQAEVVTELAEKVAAGDKRITGVMMESFIEAGAQKIVDGRKGRSTASLSPTPAWIGKPPKRCCAVSPRQPRRADSDNVRSYRGAGVGGGGGAGVGGGGGAGVGGAQFGLR